MISPEEASFRNHIAFNLVELTRVLEGESIMNVFTLRERETLKRHGITTTVNKGVNGKKATLTPKAQRMYDKLKKDES